MPEDKMKKTITPINREEKRKKRMSALKIEGDDDKKKKKATIAGYEEKSGKRHKKIGDFYKSKSDQKKNDGKVFRTKSGKTFSTEEEFFDFQEKNVPGYLRPSKRK